MLYSSLPMHQAVVPITQLNGEWHLCQRTLQVSFYPLNHLDTSNKTIDSELEVKKFEAAWKILAEIWSESIIDNHPVVGSNTSPPEKEHRKVLFHKTEEWKGKHCRQSQYMLQIVKCSDKSCCKQWRTNYLEFFSQRFFPAPVPMATSENGLQIDRAKGKF